MLYPENEALAASLQQWHTHIGDLTAGLVAAGKRLQVILGGIDYILEHLQSIGEVRPVDELIESAVAKMSADEQHKFHQITDGYNGVSHTYLVFFCSALEAFSFLAPEQSGLRLPDLLFISHVTRDIETAIQAAQAEIDEVDGEPEAHLRVAEFKRALRLYATFENTTFGPFIEEHDWFAYFLHLWVEWVESVGFSPAEYGETLGVLEAPLQRSKLIECIHRAQLTCFGLIYTRGRAQSLADLWKDGEARAVGMADGTLHSETTASQWARDFRNHSPALDYATLKAGWLALDANHRPSRVGDELSFDEVWAKARAVAKP